jgi:hypothetical protein
VFAHACDHIFLPYKCIDAGYFSLKDLEKVPEGIEVIMPAGKQAQEENRKTPTKPFGKEVFTYDRAKSV